MFANMLKSLITHGRIKTTVPKAKALRRYADRMITLAKKNTLASRRQAIAELMIRFNPLTPKENEKRKRAKPILSMMIAWPLRSLFDELGPRFAERKGGYTRIIKQGYRVGDNAQTCVVEYLAD